MMNFKWILSYQNVLCLCSLVWISATAAEVKDVEFNSDILDVNDVGNIDLSRFNSADYIMPGEYSMSLLVNQRELKQQEVKFIYSDHENKETIPCLSSDIVRKIGFKNNVLGGLTYLHGGKCLDFKKIRGMSVKGSLSNSSLSIVLPQDLIEYSSDEWDPPSRWDDGIDGFIMDYNINAQNTRGSYNGKNNQSLSGNGTTGINYGVWRFRADWQGNYNHTTGVINSSQQNFDWSRLYAYRALKEIKSRLTLGEDYLNSRVFDSFRYIGVGLRTDDTMLPPKLRGYAPEIIGIAKTNAKVTVSQLGRVIYETTVPSGLFKIQDLDSSVSGEMVVKIKEQDGSERSFRVNTATIPYLTRPGMVQYKLASGKPSDYNHKSEGPYFASGEFSWGVSNGWSLYGGAILSGEPYNTLSMGLGRDLLSLGAVSVDITGSRASLPDQGMMLGSSYKISYSKSFSNYDSQINFAGYRFTDKKFKTMSQFIDSKYKGINNGSGKELYTISLNKQFSDYDLSLGFNYGHQTYWDRPKNDSYNISLSKYFDMGNIKNISVSASAYRNRYKNTNDDGILISMAVPVGANGTVSYDGQYSRGNSISTIGYSGMSDSNNRYSIKAGTSQAGGAVGSGYYTHDGDMAKITANMSYQASRYNSFGISLLGGMTITSQGGALHRVNSIGGTRILLDTNGVKDIPVRSYSGISRSNSFGKVVVSDINNYYRQNIYVDLDSLPDDAEATRSVVQSTLTEGAIGYRRFGIIYGKKGMARVAQPDGKVVPFGATVLDKFRHTLGIVDDGGSVWLSGMKPGEKLKVEWGNDEGCWLTLPRTLSTTYKTMQLNCR